MHGTWVTPELYGLQLDRLAAGGVLVLAPCAVEGLAGFAQFFNLDMKKFQEGYQARAVTRITVTGVLQPQLPIHHRSFEYVQ